LLAVYEQDASQHIKVFDLKGNFKTNIEFPGIGSLVSASGEHDSSEFIFKFNSFTDPGSMHLVDMDTFTIEKIHQTELSDKSINYDDYITDQIFYPSKDGT